MALRLGVLISGRGSNLQALVEACASHGYPAEIGLVISNRSDAAGLQRAAAGGIPSMIIDHREPGDFAAAVDALLRAAGIELVCLAGFMRILTADFVEAWRDHIVNVHPSLLPAFRGLNAQRQALAAGVRFSGCTVHFVRPALDSGPIIAQAVVPVRPGDDEERLAARILATEHRLYPLAVRLVAEGRTRIVGDTVEIAGWRAPDFAELNPSDPDPLVRPRG
jgi:phosphoribosylglycinamide formyltransferase 1